MNTTAEADAPGALDFTQKLVILVSGLLSSLSLTAITSVLPSIAAHLAHGPNDAMLVKQLIGGVTLAMAAGAPTGGYLADKIGLRPALFAASLLYTAAGTAGLYLNSLPLLLASRLLLGLAAASIQVLGLTMINTTLTGNARARWMGLHISVAIFGTLFILPVAGQLGEISWRLPFAMYFSGLVLVAGLLLRRSGSPATAGTASLVTTAAGAGSVAHGPVTHGPAAGTGSNGQAGFPWHYLALSFVLGVLTFLPTIAIPFQLKEQTGATPSTIAYVMTATAAIGAAVAFLYGWARRSLSTHAAFLVSLGFNSVGAFIAGHSSNFPQIVAGLMIMSTGSAWFAPNVLTAAASKVANERQGRLAGLIKAAQFLSAPIAVAVVQPFVKQYGEAFALQAVAMLGFAMFVVMAVRTAQIRARPVPSAVSMMLGAILLAGFTLRAVAMPPHVDEPLTEKTVKVSEHVWAIIGFPNIGIVVGRDATLVVDTGLGRVNGATVARAALKLAPHNRLYLTSTHFHPEHAGGVLGFPPQTLLVRDQIQQDEMDRHGEEMIERFRGINPKWRPWLAGEQLRAPDETFERELRLNLGGDVRARLLWLGAAHTMGDELVLVEPDKTLISGDVVQNKTGPLIYGEGGTADSWIAVVEAAGKLGPLHVVPDHSPIGDGTLVEQDHAFLVELRDRALALKATGKSAEQAGRELTGDFKQRYPDWNIDDLSSFVKAAYGSP